MPSIPHTPRHSKTPPSARAQSRGVCSCRRATPAPRRSPPPWPPPSRESSSARYDFDRRRVGAPIIPEPRPNSPSILPPSHQRQPCAASDSPIDPTTPLNALAWRRRLKRRHAAQAIRSHPAPFPSPSLGSTHPTPLWRRARAPRPPDAPAEASETATLNNLTLRRASKTLSSRRRVNHSKSPPRNASPADVDETTWLRSTCSTPPTRILTPPLENQNRRSRARPSRASARATPRRRSSPSTRAPRQSNNIAHPRRR
mmetsp:Transcript_3985/g.14484  ORF Transcript_3985/g.14484 Transcript_3985/m.14484 type:complete len:257 (-) Transcript_3985:420-1190(-)